jgi:DNA polymerase-4
MEQFSIECERIKNPKLLGEAFALIDIHDTIQVASPEALAAGLAVGQPLSAAKILCRSLIHLPYDLSAYMKAAASVWDDYAVESSYVEPVTPEVCYIELTGRDQPARIKALMAQVSTCIGLPVQAGLAHSRFVSEQAARLSDGIDPITIQAGQEIIGTAHCFLENVISLDRKTIDRFHKLGITTLGNLVDIGIGKLPKALQPTATLLLRRGQGLDSPPIRPMWPPRHEAYRVVFEDEVENTERLEEALRRAAEAIALRLGGGFIFARRLALTLRYDDTSSVVENEEAANPLANVDALFRGGLRLMERMKITRPVTELLLEAHHIAAPGSVQLSLIEGDGASCLLPYERTARLQGVLHFLRDKYGVGAIIPMQNLSTVQRIGLWAYPLGHVSNESVDVICGSDRTPQIISRKQSRQRVMAVQDHWTESSWKWGEFSEYEVYRVLTESQALLELHRYGMAWRLASVAD